MSKKKVRALLVSEKKPRKGEKGEKRTAIYLSAETIKALDDLCDRRHVAPGKNRRARALAQLVLDAIIMQIAREEILKKKEETARKDREKRRKDFLKGLN